MGKSYHPEPYWSEVAKRINSRDDIRIIAGDDTPFYRYKRRQFLQLLHKFPFEGQRVLEIGSGPGGNLLELVHSQPKELTGADISSEMIALAKSNLNGYAVNLVKVSGESLPFDDAEKDVVFSATVLQHNTDNEMMRNTLREMCRVSAKYVLLFERIEKTEKGDDLCKGRSVEDYAEICRESGFDLASRTFLNIEASQAVCGVISKVFSLGSRKEGQPLNAVGMGLQSLVLPVTKKLDPYIKRERELCMLVFQIRR